jgi:hypothetical protein
MDLAARTAMQIITSHPAVEARGWLRGNSNPSAFATNRFQETENALAFVEMLYAAGATAVRVDDPRVDAGGQPYADTLLVRFPPDGDTRWKLERLCENEGPGDVPPGDFTMHCRENEIRLWWD